MTIADLSVNVLRIVASCLAAYNVTWAAAGARCLMRGRLRPPEIYLSVVFWMAVVILVFQASYLAGQTALWRLFAYTILCVTMGLATAGHRIGATLKARQFYAAYDHLGAAMAMVDLARVDRDAAEQLAAEARRLTAVALVASDG